MVVAIDIAMDIATCRLDWPKGRFCKNRNQLRLKKIMHVSCVMCHLSTVTCHLSHVNPPPAKSNTMPYALSTIPKTQTFYQGVLSFAILAICSSTSILQSMRFQVLVDGRDKHTIR